MKRPQIIIAGVVGLTLVVWCVHVHYRLNGIATVGRQQATDMQAIDDRLSALEVALGFDPPNSKQVSGLKRLSKLEDRVAAVEREWTAFPAGTLIEVIAPVAPVIDGKDPEPVKLDKQSVLENLPLLARNINSRLSSSSWKPAEEAETLSAKDYPAVAEMYTGRRTDTATFGLKPVQKRPFVRVKPFEPAPAWEFPGVGYLQKDNKGDIAPSSANESGAASPATKP